MAEQAQVEGMSTQERKKDCGCGCGGALCGTGRQEVIWVGSPKPVAAKGTKAGQCDCGCECCS